MKIYDEEKNSGISYRCSSPYYLTVCVWSLLSVATFLTVFLVLIFFLRKCIYTVYNSEPLLKKSAFTADELLDKILNEHVGLDVSDKIRKDISATYYEHIHKLFRLFALTDEQKNVMRLLSFAPVIGMRDEYFMQLSGVKNMNVINELDEVGLVQYS